MSDGRRKGSARRGGSRPSGARRPSPPPKTTTSKGPGQGLLGRLLPPPVPASMSSMPLYRTSLGQGFLLVGSNPVLLLVPFLLVALAWVGLLAFGFVGSPVALAQVFALPPLSSAFDTQNLVSIVGQQAGLYIALPILLVRAVVVAVVAGLVVEGFERAGSVSLRGVARGLRALPMILGALILSFFALFLAQLAAVLGPGLGILIQVFVPALALYLLGFVPFAAVRNRWTLAETFRRSVIAAREPGARHLSLCALYVLLAFLLPIAVPERTTMTANPSAASWIVLLLLTFFHLGVTAGFAYRWLGVERKILALPAAAGRR